jgi:hypothetical protein
LPHKKYSSLLCFLFTSDYFYYNTKIKIIGNSIMVSTRRSLKKEPEDKNNDKDIEVDVNNDKKKKGTPTRSSSRNKKKAVLDESPAKEDDDEGNNKVKGLFVKGVKMIENIIMGGNNKKKIQQKKRKEDLKSKNTGVGLKISLDNSSSSKITPTNRKIVFDDTNLPSENDDDDNDNDNDNEQGENPTDSKEEDDDDDDDDAVEEVQGKAAREKLLEQLKTEEKQSLKSKKKKKRKPRTWMKISSHSLMLFVRKKMKNGRN